MPLFAEFILILAFAVGLGSALVYTGIKRGFIDNDTTANGKRIESWQSSRAGALLVLVGLIAWAAGGLLVWAWCNGRVVP